MRPGAERCIEEARIIRQLSIWHGPKIQAFIDEQAAEGVYWNETMTVLRDLYEQGRRPE